MGFELRFSDEAADDVAEAYAWYQRQRVGLGEEFLTCVEAATQRLSRHPEACPKVYRDFRRAIVRRFPYSVFYEIVGQQIMVYAVFHAARDPRKWRQRLQSE